MVDLESRGTVSTVGGSDGAQDPGLSEREKNGLEIGVVDTCVSSQVCRSVRDLGSRRCHEIAEHPRRERLLSQR